MSSPGEERARYWRTRARAWLSITCSLALWLACSPSVGSEAWCEKMKETHKADWSTREAADFAKHCVFE